MNILLFHIIEMALLHFKCTLKMLAFCVNNRVPLQSFPTFRGYVQYSVLYCIVYTV